MDSIKIYSASGALLVDAILEDSSTQDWGIMSENQVTLEFYTDECVILPASCYIEFDGQRFWLLEEYKPTENNSAEWAYQVKFLGAESLLSVTVVLNTTDNLDEPIFNLTAPASQHLDFIVKNLNRRFPGMNWRAGSVPETENIHIEYVGTYASDALQIIVGEKYEWWVDDYVVNVGRCEFGTTIELGYGKGLIGGISYSTANEMRSYAYLYPIGSTRNIDPAKYGHARLQLPNGQTRIDINPEQGLSELVEADAFASIFPKYVGKVTSVRTSTGKNSDGTTFLIYHIKDTAIPFNPNDYEIAGEVKHITFQSGELMGADFEVNYDANNKEFEIITQFLDEGLSQLPGGALIPKTGDKYVVWNISMPDEYYPLAEQEFLQAALSFVQDSIKETSVYRASVDFIDLQERGLTLRPGQKVRLLSDEYFPQNGYYDSRITRIIRDICYPDELIIEVSTVVTQGTISRLRTSVSDSATKVASLGQSLKNYVDVMSPQSVRGVKNFVNGLSIGGVGLWRHPDGYVYLDETLVLKGGVVMYGNSSGVDVPSIFDSLPIDGETIKRDGNGALYVDEKALSISGGGGGGGVADSVHWANVTGKPSWIGSTKPTYKYSEIEERPDLSVYAKLTDIPSLNGYATQSWVEGKGYLLATTASNTYQPKITTNNKLAYSLISNTPDLSEYALNTDLAKKWTQNDAKIANWDSAYGWGNHANAGYAKASDVTNEFKNYVKLAGDSQSITAQHNFANGLKIGGLSLRKVDNYLYLDSSLVLSGGVTMYGDDGTTVKPIWESIPFDRTTIDWVNGMWTVVGGVGGGGISEEFLNVTLQGYQTKITSSNKLAYSLISGTPTSLSQLTDDVVAGKYLPLEGGTINGTSYNPLSIASNDNSLMQVLLYTKDTLRGRVQYNVNFGVGFQNVGIGGIYVKNDGNPIFLDSSDTSKTLLHAGNYSSLLAGGTINGSLTAYLLKAVTGYTLTSAENDSCGLMRNSAITTEGDSADIWLYNTKDIKYRAANHYFISGNVAIGGTTADAKLHVHGSVKATSFIGNLTGNADSATRLATARTIWGQSFDGTGNIEGDIAFEDNKKISWHNQPSYYYINSPTTSDGAYLQYMAYSGHRFLGGNVAIGDTHAYAKLHVHGDAIIQTLHFITNEINGVNGTGNAHINYSSTGKVTIANGGGNVAIGGTAAEAKLHVHGTAKFTGDTTFSSKVIVGTIPVYESVDGTLYVDANIVFRGGVAMFGDTTTTVNEE